MGRDALGGGHVVVYVLRSGPSTGLRWTGYSKWWTRAEFGVPVAGEVGNHDGEEGICGRDSEQCNNGASHFTRSGEQQPVDLGCRRIPHCLASCSDNTLREAENHI